jgi:acetyl-CoA carboxylase biotin carboxyl carrier protein
LAEESDHPNPFDMRKVKILAALMSRHDLSEIDLRDGEHQIRLRRGSRVAALPAAAPTPVAVPLAAPQPAVTKAGEPARKLLEIKSPTPGTFYAQEKPGAPPYVTIGARVTPSTVVCQIEAMKLFNEITADCTGVIAEILVENKQPVEFGTVLFRLDPTG